MYKHPQGFAVLLHFLVERAGEKGRLGPWPLKGQHDY